jgi:hypothetical protein
VVQELLRDDALPYAEFFQRPNTTVDYAIEWLGFLSQRWFAGLPFALNYAVRPRTPTGFQYFVAIAGLSGANEPNWPGKLGAQVVDGSITWQAAAIDNTSLTGTISASNWTADSGVTISSSSLVGTRATVFVAAASALADGDYYVRNIVTLSTGATPEGVLRISVRATKL